jgi:hypothetical protein
MSRYFGAVDLKALGDLLDVPGLVAAEHGHGKDHHAALSFLDRAARSARATISEISLAMKRAVIGVPS